MDGLPVVRRVGAARYSPCAGCSARPARSRPVGLRVREGRRRLGDAPRIDPDTAGGDTGLGPPGAPARDALPHREGRERPPIRRLRALPGRRTRRRRPGPSRAARQSAVRGRLEDGVADVDLGRRRRVLLGRRHRLPVRRHGSRPGKKARPRVVPPPVERPARRLSHPHTRAGPPRRNVRLPTRRRTCAGRARDRRVGRRPGIGDPRRRPRRAGHPHARRRLFPRSGAPRRAQGHPARVLPTSAPLARRPTPGRPGARLGARHLARKRGGAPPRRPRSEARRWCRRARAELGRQLRHPRRRD